MVDSMKIIITKSREDTIKAGEKLAKTLKPGDVVALIGELGSGKTTFTKGLAKGLGVKSYRYVNSPTFVIIKEYEGKLPLYHFDVFRLNLQGRAQACLCPTDILSFEEYFYGNGVCVIEWADRITNLLPKKCIEIRIDIAGQNKRKICIKSKSQIPNSK
jgi:tRNA threonylcarbamoyladenosine biosynthesis protein TsaE